MKERRAAPTPALLSREVNRFGNDQQCARQRFGIAGIGAACDHQFAKLPDAAKSLRRDAE